jgi:hypothetical protein
MYTKRELFPLLVELLPAGCAAELIQLIPEELRGSFGEWARGIPLEGGIQIRDGRGLPKDVVESLKREFDNCSNQSVKKLEP